MRSRLKAGMTTHNLVIPEGAKRLSGIFPNIEGSLIRSRLKAGMTRNAGMTWGDGNDEWWPG